MKKLCAMLLCITMLLSLVCVAQAATTLNFVDTFDDLAVGTISAKGVTDYAHAFGAAFYNEGASLAITEDGYKGNALTITENDTARFKIALLNETAAFAPTADAPVHVSFKLRVDNNIGEFSIDSGYDSLCCIMKSDNDYFFSPNNKSGNMTCVPGEWYDIQVKFSPNRADIRITDKNGTSVTGYRANNANYLVINSSRAKGQPTVAGQQISIDEISIIQGDGTDALNFVSSNYGVVPKADVTSIPVVDVDFDDYEASSGKSFNDYLVDTGDFAAPCMLPGNFTLTMDDDCNGGKSPRISGEIKNTSFFTNAANFDSGKAYASMKVRINVDTGANQGYFGFGKYASAANDMSYELFIRSGYFYTWNYWGRENSYKYTPDVWYTIVVEYETVNSTKCANLYIYDDKNALVYSATPTGAAANRAVDAAHMTFCFDGTANMNIDDIKVIKAESDGEIDSQAFIAKEILGVSASDPESVVHSTTPVIKASFDQIVADGSTAKFTAAGKDDIEATIKYTGSPLVEITPVTPLDYDTNYTLDLTGIKGLNGQGLAAGSATTLSVKTPVYSMGTMTYGAEYAGTTATVTVNFTNSNLTKLDAAVIGVLTKDNKLEYCSVQTLKEASLGSNTLTFTNLPEDRSGMEFKLYVWDNFASLKPLFK